MKQFQLAAVNVMKKSRSLVLAAVLVLLLIQSVRALDPNVTSSSLLRTRFGSGEEQPGLVINDVEQTRDGFLWMIASSSHLIRFDGRNFSTFDYPRAQSLAIGSDGDLWIGTPNGLVHMPPSNFNQSSFSQLRVYDPGPKGRNIRDMYFSKTGVLWLGTPDGVFKFEKDQFTPVGPQLEVYSIQEGPAGNPLVNTEVGFMELIGSELVPYADIAPQLRVKGKDLFDVLKDRSGNTWYCTTGGVLRETNGKIEKVEPNERPANPAFSAYQDPQGTIWIAKKKGMFRVTTKGLELVEADIQVSNFYTDRDGNLWVSTNGAGLYRFKERSVQMFTTKDGLPNNVIMTVMIAHDGSVWTGANCGGITRYDGKTFRTYDDKDGLSNTCVYALTEDSNHDLWVGTWGGGAYRYRNGSFTQYSKDQGLPDDRVLSIVVGNDGVVWLGTAKGLTQFKDGHFRTFTTADGLSSNGIVRVWKTRSGVIWAGTPKGANKFNGERFEIVASMPPTLEFPIGEDRSGALYFFDSTRGGTTHRIAKDLHDEIKQNGAVDLVEVENGELWFAGNYYLRIQPGNFGTLRPRDEPLDLERFSTEDGLTGSAPGYSTALALTPDGKLWGATGNGLAMFDLNRMVVTRTKPSIYLTEITIGRDKRPGSSEITVPPGTNHVKIRFAAVEISGPEKIRLQYRLDGVDSEWLDADDELAATYTSIPVGTHSLRIRACNRNGIWDRQGVVFTIIQQPYFYQTRWFIAAMVALGVLLVVLIYRLRVAQISRMLGARFDERLAERTRVARELHDTLLQTVQGSKMVADHALKNSADHLRLVRALEQLSTWLAQATDEGRAALHSLRGSTTEKNDLAEAFRRAIDECGSQTNAELSFSVNGDAREIHPVVHDEIYRIGYEAIRNACNHSGANRLEVTLEYLHDLTLRISDNGIGIGATVLEHGREGHFGLGGMKERADQIGGKFTLVSAPGTGTLITLVVPGRIAYRPDKAQKSH